MIGKLRKINDQYISLRKEQESLDFTKNQSRYIQIGKEISALEPLIDLYKKYDTYLKNFESTKHISENETDLDLRAMALEEYESLLSQKEQIDQEVKYALIPRDPDDKKNAIIEIRPGAGGEESYLFAQELSRMYMLYAKQVGFDVEILEKKDSVMILSIKGENVFSKFKYESGVHRVQRVPETENKGRVHTSTVTVAVLPEVEEVEVNINPADIAIDTMRAGGAGGQNVNKVETAVRLKYKEGTDEEIIIESRAQRSQQQNRAQAMQILATKLYDREQQKNVGKVEDLRRSQVGSGDRSEKIRTYNFPQDRITDHRINQNWSNISLIIEGALGDMIEKLTIADNMKKLEKMG